MKYYKLKESANIESTHDFTNKIESLFLEKFPKSFIAISAKKRLGEFCVFIQISLGRNSKEYASGIAMNDPLYNQFFVYGFDDNGGMRAKLSFEPSSFGAYCTKDPDGKLYSKSYRLTTKKQGTPDQVIKHWEKYLDNVKAKIAETIDIQLQLPFKVEDKI